MSELELNDTLRCPRGMPGTGVLELDLREVHRLEARKVEVPAVTKSKAPELMHAMERGYSQIASRLLPQVQWEVAQAEQAADARKAVVMLDEAPTILQQKGLSTSRNPGGSADQRENVLSLDAEYRQLRNTYEMLRAVQELLKGKMKGFEMAYRTVKTVYDSLAGYGSIKNTSHSMSAVLPDGLGAGDEISESLVGDPKY